MSVIKPISQECLQGGEDTGRYLFLIMCERSVLHTVSLSCWSRQVSSLVVDWHAKGQVPDVHMVEQL